MLGIISIRYNLIIPKALDRAQPYASNFALRAALLAMCPGLGIAARWVVLWPDTSRMGRIGV